jgi:hypothetical protein
MTRAYIQFTELFSGISPYELNHLCQVMLCKIEEALEISCHRAMVKVPLTETDLQFALTRTMRDVSLELRQQEINEQKNRLFANAN